MDSKKFAQYLREFAAYIEEMEGIEKSPGHMKLDEFEKKYREELSDFDNRVWHCIRSHIEYRTGEGYWTPTVYQFIHFEKSVRGFGKESKDKLLKFISMVK